jgi:glycosyltransferase involved in cell wall biosynthesis
MEHFGIPASRIIHSANGMDFSYVEALPKSDSGMFRFGFVGSIIKTKGVHVAVEAFLPVAEKHEDVELNIYGAPNRWSAEYLEELKRTVADRGLGDRIRFRGRFDNRKIGQVLSDIDVLLVPSIWFENAPLTLNEAAMTRTPIIVSDRGGMLEFVKANDYGRTFELGNPESLTKVMMELAADRSRASALAGNPPPIKPVAANADELIGIYERIRAGDYTAPSLEEQTTTRGGCVQGT